MVVSEHIRPPLRLVEQFVIGKFGDDRCEDAIVTTSDFTAVIDGVSDTTGTPRDGMSSGQWAVATIATVLGTLPASVEAAAAVARISKALTQEPLLDADLYTPAGAVAAIYSHHREEIWKIGDIGVQCNGKDYVGVYAMSTLQADVRCAAVWAGLYGGNTVEDAVEAGAAAVQPLLLLQHQFANRDDHYLGYAVLNGTPVPPSMIDIIDVSDYDEVILATDGYPCIGRTIAETEMLLSQSIASDPLRIGQYRACKGVGENMMSFDDRAYIKLSRIAETTR
jgi:hypothetical protein